MATDAQIYSLAEYRVAIKPETTVGTINVTTMQKVNIDQDTVITDNPHMFSEYRAKTGRMIRSADHFAEEKGQIKSITINGIADKTVFPILAENCFGIAESSGTIDLPYNFTGSAFLFGKTSVTDNLHTFTVALVSPIASNTRVYPGCIVANLNYVEDVATDGGRRHFTCTFLTRANPSDDQSTPGSMSDYPSTYYSIWDYTEKYLAGPELWDGPASIFTSGTYSWVARGGNSIANVANTLAITYVDDAEGASVDFKDAADLNSDLTVGDNYRFEADAKYAGGSAGSKFNINLGTDVASDVFTTSLARFAVDFVADNATTNLVEMTGMGASNVVTVDNISLVKSADLIISKIEVTINSNPRFYGIGINGVSETMDRGFPGIEVNAIVTAKYDANTMSQYLKYPAGTAIKLFIGDSIDIADASLGLRADFGYLTADLNLTNVDDGAFIDIPLEFKASTSGNVIKIAV